MPQGSPLVAEFDRYPLSGYALDIRQQGHDNTGIDLLLRWRLLLGTLFVAGLGVLIYLDFRATTPGLYLLPVAMLIAILAAGEMVRLGTYGDRKPRRLGIYVGTTLVVGANFVPRLIPDFPVDCPFEMMGWPLFAMAIASLLVATYELFRFETATRAAANVSYAIFSIAYVGILLSFVVQLRYVGSSEWGILALASLLMVVKMSDIGAYFVGRAVGRHKLAPKVSPGKTIEGFVGGLVFAVAGAWLAFDVVAPKAFGIEVNYSFATLVLYGVLLAAAGVVGDLSESILKRAAEKKDSSDWLPGFGGVLDMLDSVLTSAPVAYLLLAGESIAPVAGAT